MMALRWIFFYAITNLSRAADIPLLEKHSAQHALESWVDSKARENDADSISIFPLLLSCIAASRGAEQAEEDEIRRVMSEGKLGKWCRILAANLICDWKFRGIEAGISLKVARRKRVACQLKCSTGTRY